MATRKKKNIPLRTLITFFVLVLALGGVLAGAVTTSNATWTPKLALDLEGGTSLILAPTKTKDQGGAITEEDITQAIDVIRQRVDASGVAEAEIAQMGSDNITVGLPGTPSKETLDLIRSSAVMRFRAVIEVAPGGQVMIPNPQAEEAKDTEEKAAEGKDAENKETGDKADEKKTEATPAPQPLSVEEVYQEAEKYSNTVSGKPESYNSPEWVTERDKFVFANLNCTDKAARTGGSNDDPTKAIVACDKDGREKYILGPMVLSGEDIKSASSGMRQNQQGTSTGEWVVNLVLNSKGAELFDKAAAQLFKNYAGRNAVAPANNRFAIVLDSLVVSSPSISVPAYHGHAEISGSLNRESASTLANQIQFGSLPLNFTVNQESQVSATLGDEYLRVGLYAAIVGMLLVVLYLIWQYHSLSFIAVSSLALAGVITYLVITILSWSMGYRLSVAGVVGLIVAVGTVTDSFIVYFERIRDEVRDGKPLVAAVEGGWNRAKRTIVVSDMVNLVAAAVLYILAVGGVQGFAFTLGLTTLIDLVIIFLFTHPMMALFVRTRYFGHGHKFSGLDPVHLGAASDRTYLVGSAPVKRPRGKAKSVGTQSLARLKLEQAEAERRAQKEAEPSDEATEESATDDSASGGEEQQK